ncbi:MAG TPA: M28 family peptidase [Bacteroidota bacterium]|nr:M28 family peptidase [Bacteroidota bacterium]
MAKTPALVIAVVLAALAACSRNSGQTAALQTSSPSTSPPKGETTFMPSPRYPAFESGRAWAYLTAQTAFGPRNPNSAGHAACLAYIAGALRASADDVRLQEFTHTGYEGQTLRLTNVIARFRPNDPARVLLCAHWDTRPRAEQDENKARRNEPIVGANDGASGVAVLLEVADLLKKVPPAVGVDIVLFDGEDYGKEGDHASYLLGSRYFAAQKDPSYLPRFGILLDMVGDAYLDLPKEQYSVRYAPEVVDMVWKTAASLGVQQFHDEQGEEIMDDHLPLNEAGIQTIDIIDFNYPDNTNRYWHTHKDTPDHCSAASLEAVGSVIASVVYAQVP